MAANSQWLTHLCRFIYCILISVRRSRQKIKKMPRTRVQVAPAAIVCSGYDSVCRFAGPIKQDSISRLFIAFPHCRVGVTVKWWRALKRESESTASGLVFGLTWLLFLDKTDPHLNFSFRRRCWLAAFPKASGSAAVLFIYFSTSNAFDMHCFCLRTFWLLKLSPKIR